MPVSAKHLTYWEYDPDAHLTCSSCGWTGQGGDREFFDELLDVRCPECERMLLIVAYPAPEETRAAAAAGNLRAKEALPQVDAREAFLERAQASELRDRDQLPELEGERVRIEWDFEDRGGESWTVLRHEGREIWRELAYYEGYERFAVVFRILRGRYGSRLVEVRPTPASEVYLYGDQMQARDEVAALNASLDDG
jgi:hypothetical protein